MGLQGEQHVGYIVNHTGRRVESLGSNNYVRSPHRCQGSKYIKQTHDDTETPGLLFYHSGGEESVKEHSHVFFLNRSVDLYLNPLYHKITNDLISSWQTYSFWYSSNSHLYNQGRDGYFLINRFFSSLFHPLWSLYPLLPLCCWIPN